MTNQTAAHCDARGHWLQAPTGEPTMFDQYLIARLGAYLALIALSLFVCAVIA